MIRRPTSLVARVTLAAVAAVGGALLVAGLVVTIASGRSDRRSLDRELQQLTARIAGPATGLIGRPPGPDFDAGVRPPGERPRFARPAGPLDPGADRFVRLVQPNGVAFSQGASVPDGFPVPAASSTPASVHVGGADWRTVVRDLGAGGARLQVAARLGPLQARARRLRLVVLAAIFGALLATTLLTRALVRVALGPLDRLRGSAREVAHTADLGARVPVGQGPEEVDALAGELNAMLGRLELSAGERERALQSARRFAADAGHELRTPLTSLRANLSTGSLDAAELDAARLASLVEQLQALARGESGPPAAVESLDLGELADSAVVALRARHPELDVRLHAPARGPLLSGERGSLAMLLDNLLENAARHGRPAGTVVVTVTPTAGGAELLVEDDGPGVPADERPRVLERFERGHGARGSGSGLGLSIAAAQAARHDGTLELTKSPLGGLCVAVRLGGAAGAPAGAGAPGAAARE